MTGPPAWVRDAVFYQIFPDRFAISSRVEKPGPLEPWDARPTVYGFKGGDLLGIVERLPYLAELGINALYLNPIFASASNHRYHTYDYFRVDPLLGGDAAFDELLRAAHDRGIRIVLDGVFNHVGRGFWPFHHVLESGADSPYREWFILDEERLRTRRLDPYPADPTAPYGGDGRSLERLGYRSWWDLPALPKLNTNHPAAREYLFTVAEHWLRRGIDGWRLDVPEEIDDPPFWREFRQRCRAVNPDAYLVGEIWHQASDWLTGDRLDGLMNYPLAEAIIGFVAGRHLDAGLVNAQHEYAANIRSHDGRAFAERLTAILAAFEPEVTAAQLNLVGSHDTPRLRSICGGDTAAVRLAMLLQATLPGAPCTYYGDEIGLEGGMDPDCRRSFPADESRWDHDLLAFARRVFQLRKAEPALRADGVGICAADGHGLIYERRHGDSRFLVALNAGEDEIRLAATVVGAASGPIGLVDLPGRQPTSPPTLAVTGPDSLEIVVPARDGLLVKVG